MKGRSIQMAIRRTSLCSWSTAALAVVVCLACSSVAPAQAQNKPDRETARWWSNVQYMASDQMEGRDTGTPAYDRAAEWVAQQFKDAGLTPAGTDGYLQNVPMHQVALDSAKSSVALVREGKTEPLKLLHDLTVSAAAGVSGQIDAPLVFAGYGTSPDDIKNLDLKGKAVVIFGGVPKGTENANAATQRARLLAGAGAAAVITIANPRAIEPAKWPFAYSRSVRLRDAAQPPSRGPQPYLFTFSADAAPRLLAGSGHEWNDILDKGAAGEPLPSFEIPARFTAKLEFEAKDIASPNVLAVLPGSDPALKNEYVVISAHLDGYGYGEPVNGDNLYNGAFDDAAYVSTLIEFARLAREQHKTYRRSVLLAVVTGEEKGLLGSAYFTAHPTVPREQLVADINLDQLRPIFPLKILTVEGLDDTSLGDTARQVAKEMDIEIRRDMEPQRNLFRRSDNFNFIRIGVPAVGFVFGYNPGSPEEKIYRAWYAQRYHRPSDDTTQPIDFTAAGRMNTFVYRMAAALADAPSRPAWNPNSPWKPKSATGE